MPVGGFLCFLRLLWFVKQVWDGDSYDHRLTIQAHTSPVTAITSCFAAPAVAKPVKLPVGNSLAAIAALSTAKSAASKGTVIFTAAMDGSVKAWKASSGELWEIQPMSYHSHPIKALQFVPFGPTQRPTTSRPAPIHSGILPAVVTDKDSSVPITQASDTGSFSNKSPRDAPMGGIEPSVTVLGCTPAHTHSRLLTVAGDGRLAVFDIYTGACVGVSGVLVVLFVRSCRGTRVDIDRFL
jgi:WD40 repeat protein